MLYVDYYGGAASALSNCRFKFTPASTSNIPVTYPEQVTIIATDGVQFRYTNAAGTKDEGFKATEDGAKVIQDGEEYNMLGAGALNSLTAPRRIVVCTDYPNANSMESDVLYIKVSSS